MIHTKIGLNKGVGKRIKRNWHCLTYIYISARIYKLLELAQTIKMKKKNITKADSTRV